MQNLRVLVQAPGYLHYEDMRAFLSVETSQTVSMLFDLLLNRQEMLFPELDKLAQGDITWLRAKAGVFLGIKAKKLQKCAKNDSFELLTGKAIKSV